MSEFARDVGFGASPGLADAARRRRARKLPVWLRFAVILAVTLGLWVGIFLAFATLFAG
jgi:type VI protein secretion system component VasF